MDIFILAGQSNMAGRGELDDISERELQLERTVTNDVEIVYFNASGEWVPARDPLHSDKHSAGVGPGLCFAKELALLGVVAKGRKIGLIPCAVGGTSISQWTGKSPPPQPKATSAAAGESPPRHKASSTQSLPSIDELAGHRTVDSKEKDKDKVDKAKESESTSSSQRQSDASDTSTGAAVSSEMLANDRVMTGGKTPTGDSCGVGVVGRSGRPLLEETLSVLVAAMESARCQCQVRAILWHQGESDCADLSVANSYLDSLVSLMTAFRGFFERELGDRFLPILVGGLPDYLGQRTDQRFMYYTNVNQQLSELPHTLPMTAFVSTKDLTHKGDFLHLDTDSARQLGVRYARAYAKLTGHDVKHKKVGFFRSAVTRTKQTSWQKWMGIFGLCVVAYIGWAEWKRRTDMTKAKSNPDKNASS